MSPALIIIPKAQENVPSATQFEAAALGRTLVEPALADTPDRVVDAVQAPVLGGARAQADATAWGIAFGSLGAGCLIASFAARLSSLSHRMK